MPRGSGSSQQQTTSMSHPARRGNWKCVPTMAPLSEETVQALAHWLCPNLPLNVYAPISKRLCPYFQQLCWRSPKSVEPLDPSVSPARAYASSSARPSQPYVEQDYYEALLGSAVDQILAFPASHPVNVVNPEVLQHPYPLP